MLTSQQNPPAGWYPDPIGESQFRFWDGGMWTDAHDDHPLDYLPPIPDLPPVSEVPPPPTDVLSPWGAAFHVLKTEFLRSLGIKKKKVPAAETQRRYPTRDMVGEVMRRDEGRCVECGAVNALQIDHIIPFSKGGATSVENLQVLCGPCNREKSDKI